MENFYDTLYAAGIVPVIKLNDAKDAAPLANALKRGGLRVLEVTFRTECAAQAMENIKKDVGGVTLIAGTVLNVENAERAVSAGAQAIVAPGLNPEVVRWCIDNKIPVCPGVSTASEIEQALQFGLKLVKFFPAEAVGGLKVIQSLAAPYGGVQFMPTGGINENNVAEYLACDRIQACGGSWMVQEKHIAQGRFDEIEQLTRQAVRKMLGLALAHVGINGETENDAAKLSAKTAALTGWEIKTGSSSLFVGDAVEIMKTPGFGANGHVAFAVNDVSRAVAYYAASGVKFNENSKKYGADGKLNAVYFSEEIGGFAVHLVRKKS